MSCLVSSAYVIDLWVFDNVKEDLTA